MTTDNNEDKWDWPASVKSRIEPYAKRMEISEEVAYQQFTTFLQQVFSVSAPQEEDEFFFEGWAETFVIDHRNLGPATGSKRDTVTYLGHIVGLDEYINDSRRWDMERATDAWNNSSGNAIEQKLIGVVSAKDGYWNVNGEPTREEVKGGELPWFGFEYDNRILCLLNQNEQSQFKGKPMAPKSLGRIMYFLGNEENEFGNHIQCWRIQLSGDDMESEYNLHVPCKIQVVPQGDKAKDNKSDMVYTNRGFAKGIVYTDDFVDDDMKVGLQAERFLINPTYHSEYVELDDLMEAHDERKKRKVRSEGYYDPFIITKGYVSRLNREPSDHGYGPSYRMAITSLALQSTYGRDSSLSEVTIWVPGRIHDETHPFDFHDGERWRPYAERTQVIVFGKLKLKEFNGQESPSLTTYGVYVPPRTARPGAEGGDTSLDQFGGEQ